MRYLLDTNILLWYLSGDQRLSPDFREIIDRSDSVIYVSAASLWEIAIKYSLKRLDLQPDIEAFFNKRILQSTFQILSIEPQHILAVASLHFHHRDPFDRMILVQSKIEKLELLYTDPSFDLYK